MCVVFKKMSQTDGKALIAKGDKLMKGSWFHKPNYDEASQVYTNAANLYRAGREWPECVDAYEKASDAFMKNGIGFSAAECLEKCPDAIIHKFGVAYFTMNEYFGKDTEQDFGGIGTQRGLTLLAH